MKIDYMEWQSKKHEINKPIYIYTHIVNTYILFWYGVDSNL